VIGVIVQSPSSLALPYFALGFLALAVALLITSLNGSIWANYYDSEPPGPATISADTPWMENDDYQHALQHYRCYSFWVNLARYTYQAGIYSLWIGLGVALIPHGTHFSLRLLVLVPILAALIAEFALSRLAPKIPLESSFWLLSAEANQTGQHDDNEAAGWLTEEY
jgi:hypothetical protein